MKKKFFIALMALTITGTMCSCQTETTQNSAVPQSSTEISQTSTVDESSEEKISSEDKINDMLEKDNYSGIVLAVKDGEYVYTKGINNNGQTFDTKSVFRLASVSKQFTAAGIMLLQEQGKLSVSDTLDKYFPEYSHAKELTIHNLLTMHSGIPDYMDNYDILSGKILTDDIAENKKIIMEHIFSQDLIFQPNERYKYSNSNYFLLAHIIEQLSGVSHEEFITENIFKPLEMTSTGFFDSYSVEDAQVVTPDIVSYDTEALNKPSITFGAGDIMSNADDLAKWLKVFEGGSILSDETIEAMSTSYSSEDDEEQYGYGFMIGSDGIYHGGNLPDFTTVVYTSPENKYSIIMLCNKGTNTIFPLMNNIRYELF